MIDTTDTTSVPPVPIYAAASRDTQTGDILLKIVNVSDAPQPLVIDLPGAQCGKDRNG